MRVANTWGGVGRPGLAGGTLVVLAEEGTGGGGNGYSGGGGEEMILVEETVALMEVMVKKAHVVPVEREVA